MFDEDRGGKEPDVEKALEIFEGFPSKDQKEGRFEVSTAIHPFGGREL